MTPRTRSADSWKEIVASSLDWEQAHLSLESALRDLPANLRGCRPAGLPHSVWEIIEHIRIGQHDLLEFCRNPKYKHDLQWPADYWPSTPEPPDDAAWSASLSALREDRDALHQFTIEAERDLAAKIPAGTGQTYLRTVLVALDHAAYHVGELIAVRRLLGAWPPE